jgi:hypothetical protein
MSADHCAAFGEALRERGLCHTRQDSVDLICNMFQFKTLWQCSLLVILLATIMLFSKHHCQKVFKMKHISYKIWVPRAAGRPPHGEVRPFYQKSTCLAQSTLGPYAVIT